MSEFPPEKIAESALAALRANNCTLDKGLSDAELSAAEARVGCTFPPDLAALLGMALPTGKGFPTWRELGNPALSKSLEWPIEGIVFDVLHGTFWHPSWETRPDSDAEAESMARRKFASVPPVIPLAGHRYLPSSPAVTGNPVLSIWQTDVIVYGENLAEWAANEFGRGWQPSERGTELAFWDYVIYEQFE